MGENARLLDVARRTTAPSLSRLRASLQGEWDLQPLPKIVSTLEEPTPHCPSRGAQSPAGPTVVNIGRGRA